MKAIVFDQKIGFFQVEIGELVHRLPKDGFFWLDIDSASAEELQTVTSVLKIAEPASSWPALRTAGQIRGGWRPNSDFNICRWGFRSAH